MFYYFSLDVNSKSDEYTIRFFKHLDATYNIKVCAVALNEDGRFKFKERYINVVKMLKGVEVNKLTEASYKIIYPKNNDKKFLDIFKQLAFDTWGHLNPIIDNTSKMNGNVKFTNLKYEVIVNPRYDYVDIQPNSKRVYRFSECYEFLNYYMNMPDDKIDYNYSVELSGEICAFSVSFSFRDAIEMMNGKGLFKEDCKDEKEIVAVDYDSMYPSQKDEKLKNEKPELITEMDKLKAELKAKDDEIKKLKGEETFEMKDYIQQVKDSDDNNELKIKNIEIDKLRSKLKHKDDEIRKLKDEIQKLKDENETFIKVMKNITK